MIFGNAIFDFYNKLSIPDNPPEGVDILLPFLKKETKDVNEVFYHKYYHNDHDRIFLIGINPGRFGAGITGIPFTDPINLDWKLGIPNKFEKKHELSSRFIFSLIENMNGPEAFYGNFYFTSISPVGFVSGGKNINYYDTKELMSEKWEEFYVESLITQIKAGANSFCAYSLGTGKNIKYLEYLNNKYKLFKKVEPLPHPRWVMQYRYRRQKEFIDLYASTLRKHISQ